MSEYREHYMQQAFALAKRTNFYTSPNPRVGCVIVKDQKIIGEGFHNGPGTDHAEMMALKSATTPVNDADLYVTLEPCCHFGRTAPCVDALIRSKIKRVFAATLDPNPIVSGKGFQALEDAGISVEHGFLMDQAKNLNRYFFHFMEKQRPYIICKWAMSLDGYRTTHDNNKKISSIESQKATHRLRHKVDAILIGYKTALIDNPELTVRFSDEKMTVRHPIRFILDSQGRLPTSLSLFSQKLPGKTVLITTEKSSNTWRNQLSNKNIELCILPEINHHISLQDLMCLFYKKNILSVLVEGGEIIHNAFFSENLVDEVQTYIAPIIIGDLPNRKKIITNTSGDIYVHGYC